MDIIANLISHIQLGIIKKLKFITLKKSNIIINILKILQKEMIILGFIVGKTTVKIFLNYKIKNIKLIKISKASNRVYIPIKKLQILNQGLGITLLSTTKGILTDIQAKSQNVGGELLCQIQWN